jgi:predicted nucleic acid-binding protein
MIVYLDMNIVFDYLVGRQPYGQEAAQILTLLRNEKIDVFMAPNAIIMAFAILRQQPNRMSHEQIKHSLILFRKLVGCVPVNNDDVDAALSSSDPDDLEDGFQIVLAKKCGATVIISNDRSGFRDSPIEVMNSKTFLRNWEFS